MDKEALAPLGGGTQVLDQAHYGVLPYIVPSILVLLWVASKTSVREQ